MIPPETIARESPEGIAREIVMEWLGLTDPPIQIRLEQSEYLQQLIAAEVARLKVELAEAHERWNATARELGIRNIEYFDLTEAGVAREATARSDELRYLATFSPILDKRVQTTEQLFGWMAACEAWRAAIGARRAP